MVVMPVGSVNFPDIRRIKAKRPDILDYLPKPFRRAAVYQI